MQLTRWLGTAAIGLSAAGAGCGMTGSLAPPHEEGAPRASARGPAAAPKEIAVETQRPNRVSLTVQQDVGIVSGQHVCDSTGQLRDGFACFRADQTQYHGHPKAQAGGDPDGLFPATTRLLLGFDRVLWERITLGMRAGVVLHGGGPKPDGASAPSFLLFHGELRAAYWFGDAPFLGTGLRVGLLVNAGIAQVDSAFQVGVVEDRSQPPPAAQPDNPDTQTLEAYKKSGTGFVGGGLTLAYSFVPAAAAILHLKVMQLFPSAGTVLAPEIGYEHAF